MKAIDLAKILKPMKNILPVFNKEKGGWEFLGNGFQLVNPVLTEIPEPIVTVEGPIVMNPVNIKIQLKSLRNFPSVMPAGTRLDLHNSLIESLEGCPKGMSSLDLSGCIKLTNLGGIPKTLKILKIGYNPMLPMLRLFHGKYENIEWSPAPPGDIQAIWMRYYGQGIGAMLPCAAELIKAGYRNNARI